MTKLTKDEIDSLREIIRLASALDVGVDSLKHEINRLRREVLKDEKEVKKK